MMMRRVVILLTLLVSFGFSASWRLSARATPASEIPSLAVMSLVPEGENILYAGVRGGSGVYRTGNNGANWNAYGDRLGSSDIVSMGYRDGVLYAGTWGKGVYYRSSGMSEWALGGALDSGYNYVRAMSCDSAGNLYAADPDLAIYRLESSSQTAWQRLASTNLPGSDSILCLFSDSDNRLYMGLLSGGVYSYAPGSSYYNGRWEAVGSLSGVEARVMIEGPDGKIWLATNAGIRCLENSQWAGPLAGAEGLYVTALLRNPDIADQVLLGTNNGEVYSYSAQQGMAPIAGLGIPAGKRVWSLAVGQNGRLFAGTAEGLYYADGVIATPTPLPPTATPTATATPTRTPTPTITRTPTVTSTPPQGFWEIIALPLTRK